MRVPNIHWCSSRPRLPSGFSRLWSGPAPKPSSEIEKPATRTLGITYSLPYQRFYGRPDDGVTAPQVEIIGHSGRIVPKLFADFAAQGESEIWNIQISDQVTAPVIRQLIKRGHGNM
jgi:hypothetical protein